MDPLILKTVGQVAGLAGVALGVFLLLFRDVIRKKIFPMLTKQQAFRLLTLLLVLVWTVALFGIGAWVWLSRAEPPSERIWLHIVDLEGFPYPKLHVIATVNSQDVVYPTGAQWTGRIVKPAAFPLPSDDEYAVKFKVIAKGDDSESTFTFVSEEVMRIPSDKLPFSGTYELHQAGTEMVGAGPIEGRVRYELSKDPNRAAPN